jgi:mono/diheme cytochrome c family protein
MIGMNVEVPTMDHKTILLTAAAILGSGLFLLTAQQPDTTTGAASPSAVFTAAQAEAGRAAYEDTCGRCHTPTLLGRKGDPGELPPLASLSASYREFIGPRGYVAPLAGKEFLDRWGSTRVSELIARFQQTVPAFPPEGMNDETTVNITAYVLQVNGAKAGTEPLTRRIRVLVSSITQ